MHLCKFYFTNNIEGQKRTSASLSSFITVLKSVTKLDIDRYTKWTASISRFCRLVVAAAAQSLDFNEEEILFT